MRPIVLRELFCFQEKVFLKMFVLHQLIFYSVKKKMESFDFRYDFSLRNLGSTDI